MKNNNLLLIGNGTAAVRVLRALKGMGIPVPLVIADPRDDGKNTWRLSLVGEAGRLGYRMGKDLLAPENPNAEEVLERIRGLDIAVILSVQCARILRRPLLDLARRGAINLHNAPLPLLRGCDPFAWAIHDGLLEMGVSLHRIEDEGVDNGPVLAQRRWPIKPDSTAWDLYQQALEEVEPLVAGNISAILAGELVAAPQDERYVTYHPMGQFPFRDKEIDWDRGSAALSAWIRSRIFPPIQLPFFSCKGKSVEVLRCRRVVGKGRPGSVLEVDPLRIAARSGAIELMELRYDGELMAGASFARLAGLRPGSALLLGGHV